MVGFTWGGWVTGGTAQDMAQTAGDESRYELASVICAEKFLAAPNAQAQLAELKAIDSSYRQRQFIEEGGWAVMPSKEEATRQAADLCAKVLTNLAPETPAESQLQPASTAQ